MSWQAVDAFKRQIPYWTTYKHRIGSPLGGSLAVGSWTVPLHADHKPSFLVDPQNLFYCYGCGLGGDVICFAGCITECDSRRNGNAAPPHRY